MEEVILPDGEQYKSLEVLSKVWDKALAARLDRNSTFVALGGGVIGDMGGFAAAAYQRGVHFIQARGLTTSKPMLRIRKTNHVYHTPTASVKGKGGRCGKCT